jgi:hypothetical protein
MRSTNNNSTSWEKRRRNRSEKRGDHVELGEMRLGKQNVWKAREDSLCAQ